jgi:hypothetical protein
MRSFVICILTQYCAGDQIEKKEMDGACSPDGEEKCLCRVLVGKPEGKRPLGRPRLRWKIILGWIFRKWDVGVWTGFGRLRIETGGGHF